MTASTMAHNTGKHPTARDERKMRKPLIERKRRERINNCLDQLKETVIGAFRLDQSKLEKADILEMTVKHLQNIQSSKVSDSTSGLEAQQKYSTGYIQCMHEVRSMLLTCDWMDKSLGSRLLNHLLKSLPRSTDELPLSQPTATHTVPPPAGSRGLLGSALTEENLLHRDGTDRCGSHLGMLEMWRPW
ncbi:transcription cofactor HES-6-like [Solea senegalensis]|uniref:Transcription cofactor HES-6-like n=2 Tax=Solea senegalensis TaxID=28829 RepID=A0AAV6PG05_SOLSE|nr:transcription factor HES-1-like [Solea senegalensis]KAG7456364.1 transcription cofactor HES-6-like [Solea senegalensis]